jgi:tetratricopeptide (TPR) repeat protein
MDHESFTHEMALFASAAGLQAARGRVDAALAAGPDDPDCLTAAALVDGAASDFTEALDRTEVALGIDPAFTPALALRIGFLQELGRYADAEAAAQHALAVVNPPTVELLLALAAQHSELDHDDEAMTFIDRALETAPDHPDALAARIGLLALARRYDEADKCALLAFAAHPEHPQVLLAIAHHHESLDQYDEAVQWYDRVLAIDPRHADALAERIYGLRWAGRYDDTEEAARLAVETHPDDADIAVTVAGLHSSFDQDSEALEWLDRAIALDPRLAGALKRRPQFLNWAGRVDEIPAAIEQALAVRPGDPDILLSAARAYLWLDRDDDSFEQLAQVLAVDERHPGALAARISYLDTVGRYDEAESAVGEAIRLRPANPQVLVTGAYHHSDLDRDSEALDLIDRALAVNPRHADALLAKLAVLQDAGRHEEAQATIRRAAEARPLHLDLTIAAADYYQSIDDDETALTWAERALAIDPRDDAALAARIRCLRSTRRYEEADAAVLEATSLRPRSPQLAATAADHFKALDRLPEALSWIDRLLAIAPRHEGGLTVRIGLLRRTGQYDEAEGAIRTALEALRSRPDLALEIARYYDAIGSADESLRWIAEALTFDPRHVGALEAKINLLTALTRYDEAGQAIAAALDLRPENPEIALAIARHHSALDHDNEAVSWVDRALAIEPDHLDGLVSRIDLLRWAGRYEEVDAAIATAVEFHPESAIVARAAAGYYSAVDRDDEAVQWIDRALELSPRDADVLADRFGMLRSAGHDEAAEQAVRQAIRIHPEHVDIALAVANYYTLDREDEAVLWIDRALTIEPRHAGALAARISCLRWAGRPDEVAQATSTALERCPNNLLVIKTVAIDLSLLDRDDEAIHLIEQGLAKAPGSADLLRAQINLLRWDRRYDDADAVYQRAVALHPDNPDLLSAGAQLYSAKDAELEAAALCDRILELDPRHTDALTSRVDYLRWADQLDAAEAAVRTAMDRRPRDPDPLLAAAKVSVDRNELKAAVRWTERALELDRHSTDAMVLRIDLLRRDRRYDEALTAAEAAVGAQPRSTEILLALGRVQDARLTFEDALATFGKGLAIAPTNTTLRAAYSATLRSMHRYSDAEQTIIQGLDLRPRNRDLRTEMGWIHHDQRRLADAKQIFEALHSTAITKAEQSSAAMGLGWTAFTHGNYQRAEELFREAVRLEPDTDDTRLSLAWALTRQEEKSRLLEARAIAAQICDESSNVLAHVCLGVLAFKTDDLPSADFHLRRALELDPYAGSLTDLGALYSQLNRFEEAEKILRQAVDRDWYDTAAHVELGAVVLAASPDRLREAELHFRHALASDSGAGVAAIGLAQTLERSGDDAEAELVLRRCLLNKDVQSPWRVELALARVLIGRGDKQQNADIFADAYQHAIRAIERAPGGEADPHYVAGVAYHRMGSLTIDAMGHRDFRRRATRHLKNCLDRDPEHIEAQRGLLLLDREIRASIPAIRGGYALAVLSIVLLALSWTGFFLSSKISGVLLASITPVLAGLFAISILLPSLIRLKMPGFEADLQAGSGSLSPGPTGEVAVGPNRFSVSTGPSGNLARRRYPAGEN